MTSGFLVWLVKHNWSVVRVKKLYVHLQAAEGEIITLHYVIAWVSFMVEACEVEYHIVDQLLNMWDIKCQHASLGIFFKYKS